MAVSSIDSRIPDEDEEGLPNLESNAFTRNICLEPLGDEDSGFHLQRNPRKEGHQWHREAVVLKKGVILTRCNLVDVVHGKWEPEGSEYGTLIVFHFRFDVLRNARRISRADININFRGEDEDTRPEVVKIGFDDTRSLVEQKQTVSTTKSISGTGGANPAQIAELSGTLKWEQTVSADVTSYTTITGNKFMDFYDWGGDDQVNWVLRENEKFGTGIPVAFRAAVLLKRKDMSCFKCDVDIKVEAGMRNAVKDAFEKLGGRDDPVLFDPTVEFEGNSRLAAGYNAGNLSAFDPQIVSHVTFLQYDGSAVKGKEALY